MALETTIKTLSNNEPCGAWKSGSHRLLLHMSGHITGPISSPCQSPACASTHDRARARWFAAAIPRSQASRMAESAALDVAKRKPTDFLFWLRSNDAQAMDQLPGPNLAAVFETNNQRQEVAWLQTRAPLRLLITSVFRPWERPGCARTVHALVDGVGHMVAVFPIRILSCLSSASWTLALLDLRQSLSLCSLPLLLLQCCLLSLLLPRL